MSHDVARALMRTWWERLWGESDLDVVGELLADPYTRHTASGSSTITPQEYGEMLVRHQRILHKPTTTVDSEAVAGDHIWNRATMRGLNLETGDITLVTWFVEHRIEGDRIAESWIATLSSVDWNR